MLRQRFWDNSNISRLQHQNGSTSKPHMSDKPVPKEATERYRKQYVNEKPVSSSNQSSYVDSYFRDGSSVFDTRSISTTRTSLWSREGTRMLPDIEVPKSTGSRLELLDINEGGSILMQTYSTQTQKNPYNV